MFFITSGGGKKGGEFAATPPTRAFVVTLKGRKLEGEYCNYGDLVCCSSTGNRTTRRLTSLRNTTPEDSDFDSVDTEDGTIVFGRWAGTQWPGVTRTSTSLTAPFEPGTAVMTLPSLNCPRRAFWSQIQTTSPTATFLSVVCHFDRIKRFGPASCDQDPKVVDLSLDLLKALVRIAAEIK